MMIFKKNLTAIFIGLLTLSSFISIGQELPSTKTFIPQDTVRTIEILPGVRKLEYRKIDSVTEVQILAGNVRLRQGTSIFECDSCVITKRLNLFEAFGNVHINDADTTDVYADHLRYLTDKRIAYLDNNVKLTDGKGVLTTRNLEYDVNTKVGIYKNGGKVVNKKTVLTSEEGYYYTDLKDVYFKKNVRLKDPKYELESDSLLYNTETETSRFIAETFIKDSSNRTIRTREGYYNLKTGKAEFGQRPVVQDGAIQATGDNMISDDSTGTTQITGRAILIDTAANRTVLADEIFFNNKTESFLATKKPLMIIKQENDSIFIAADTLFSAKLTDLYSNKDSVFRLYDNPVLWSKESQITGDTILLFTKNKKADKMEVFKNSFIANMVKPEIFNQVKSVRMDAYFVDGSIDSVRARNQAECIYYIMDEDSAFTGINQSSSELMDIYFSKQELQRVVFRSEVKGTIWPMKHKTPQEMKLENFKWREAERPKTKYELFE